MSGNDSLEYCRFCAEQKLNENIIDFTKLVTSRNDVVGKIQFFNLQWIDITAENLPTTICNICYNSLSTAYEFFIKIEYSQVILKNVFKIGFNHAENSNFKPYKKVRTPEIQVTDNDEDTDTEIQVDDDDDELIEVEDTSWSSYPWICKDCGSKFNSMSMLKEHSKEVHEKCNNFQCADCKTGFKCFSDFIDHVRAHRDRQHLINFCEYCNVDLLPGDDHVELHKCQPHCEDCGELFEVETARLSHVYLYQPQPEQPVVVPALIQEPSNERTNEVFDEDAYIQSWSDYPWICQWCNMRFLSQRSLRFHHRSAHLKCCGIRCNDCYKNGLDAFYDSDLFFEHVITEHRPNLKLYCQYCNHKFHDNNDTIVHLALHRSGPQCKVCGDSFRNPAEVIKHKITYSASKRKLPVKQKRTKQNFPFKKLTCFICSKVFKNPVSVQRHMKLHADRTKDFCCDICGKSFGSQSSLHIHSKVHNSESEQCKICSKSFATLRALKIHIKRHSEQKPFQCDHCKKFFKIKESLKKHISTHMNIYPHKCKYCKKKFKLLHLYKNHLSIHLGSQAFACPSCPKKFSNWTNCNKHMVRLHGTTLKKGNPVSVEETPENEEIKEWAEDVDTRDKEKIKKRGVSAQKMKLRMQIVKLWEEGYTEVEIAKKLKTSRQTAVLWVNRHREFGSLENRFVQNLELVD